MFFEDKVSKVEQNFCGLKGKVTKVEEDLKCIGDTENIHCKPVELEDHRLRCNNITIDVIKEDSTESWEECERRVFQC